MTETQITQGLADFRQRDKAMYELTEQFGPRLFHRIRSIVEVEADAQDVYQNTLIKVLRGIHSFKANSSLYSWLYRIASNEAYDILRKRKRTASWPGGSTERSRGGKINEEQPNRSALSYHAAETNGADATEIEDLVTAAIAELPPQQRLIFEARYFEETPYAELSKKFQKSEGALKANYHHAVQKVTAFIKAHAPISIS